MLSVFSVHILTWGPMNAVCWLAENDIIIRDVRFWQIPTEWNGREMAVEYGKTQVVWH